MKLTLPPVCYAVVGLPMNIYYDNMVLTPHPTSCTFRSAAAWPGRRPGVDRQPQAGEAGDHDWGVTVTDAQGRRLASAGCKLHVAPTDAGSRGSLRLLLVGDSLTHASIYPNHIARLLAAPGNPTTKLLGTFRPAGVQPGVAREGYGGWSWQRFASHFEPHPDGTYGVRSSLFVFLEAGDKPVLDVPRYIQTACAGTPPDVGHVPAGHQRLFRAKADDPKSVDDRIGAMFKQADVLLAAFHQAGAAGRTGRGPDRAA